MNEQVLAVQRMQDYIEDHITQEIHLSDLSLASYFSPWYSYRLFAKYLSLTPAEYIRKLRLSKAAQRLKNESIHIIDIAYEMGFGNVDTFTRAFYREFGLNPSDYVKNKKPIPLFIPYGAKYRELRKEPIDMKNIQTIYIQKIHKPERLCIIKRAKKADDYFPYCEEVSCDIWGILLSMCSSNEEPVCMWLSDRDRKPDTSIYVQGVEKALDDPQKIPEGFDVIQLPASDYLMFQGQPFEEEDYCEAIAAVQQAIDQYDPKIMGYQWDDENPRIQLEPKGERGYIELRSIKKN